MKSDRPVPRYTHAYYPQVQSDHRCPKCGEVIKRGAKIVWTGKSATSYHEACEVLSPALEQVHNQA